MKTRDMRDELKRRRPRNSWHGHSKVTDSRAHLGGKHALCHWTPAVRLGWQTEAHGETVFIKRVELARCMPTRKKKIIKISRVSATLIFVL